jgi:hypothetical protein
MILEIENTKRIVLKNLFKKIKPYYIKIVFLKGILEKPKQISVIKPTIARLRVGELIAFGGDTKHHNAYD